MTISEGMLVYDTTDPLRYVGEVIETKGRKAYVRWHATYSSWVLKTVLSGDVQGKQAGEKL